MGILDLLEYIHGNTTYKYNMARKAKETWRKVNQDIKFTSWEQINLIFFK
jgi:hypothetical protein